MLLWISPWILSRAKINHAVTRRRAPLRFPEARACSPPCGWPWSNPESVDTSPLRGPRLSGGRGEVRPRAVQLFVHQHQREQLLQRGPIRPPSEDYPDPGERRQEGERPVRLVLDREVDQDIVRRRPRELPLLLRVHSFRSSARRHQLPPLLLPRLNPPAHPPHADRASALIDLDDFPETFCTALGDFSTVPKRQRVCGVSRCERRDWYIISDVMKRCRPLCYSRHTYARDIRRWRTRRRPAVLARSAEKCAEIESRHLENALKQISIDDGDLTPSMKITKLDLTSRRRRFPLGRDCEVKSSGSNDESEVYWINVLSSPQEDHLAMYKFVYRIESESLHVNLKVRRISN